MTEKNDEQHAALAIERGAYEEAVGLLKPLAERNSEYALLTLGWIYETGATGTPDKEAARSFYEHAASRGNATACLNLGWLLFKDGHEFEARAAFERGAQLNNDECKSALARLNDNADERLADEALKKGEYKEAVRLLLPLAERNSEYALYALGYICEAGVTGTPDAEAARSYYERAASQGKAAAYYNLGRLFSRNGDHAKARAAFRAGAERGDLSSMSGLGTMMVDGGGAPTEVDAGIAWLEKAAANGHIFAQRKLLVIKERNSKSMFEKLSVRMKIAALAIKWARKLKDTI